MTTPSEKTWDVIPATERITVDSRRQAETTVKVVNMGTVPRRATLTVTTDPAAAAWFTVTEPERTVDPGASATYPVTVTIPPEVPAAAYAFQVTARSSDGTPEPPSHSPPVILEIPAGQAARPPFTLWWLAAPAALLLVAAGVVTAALVARPSQPQHEAQPSPTAAEPSNTSVGPSAEVPQGLVTVPDVTGLDEAGAVTALTGAGLNPVVKHRHDPANLGRIVQSVPAGIAVAAGTAIEIELSVRLSQPSLVSPTDGQRVEYVQQPNPALSGYDAVQVWISWTQPESYVTRWELRFGQYFCYRDRLAIRTETYLLTETQIVTTTSITSLRYFRSALAPSYTFGPCHRELVQVAPLDDFGNAGPSNQTSYYGPKYQAV